LRSEPTAVGPTVCRCFDDAVAGDRQRDRWLRAGIGDGAKSIGTRRLRQQGVRSYGRPAGISSSTSQKRVLERSLPRGSRAANRVLLQALAKRRISQVAQATSGPILYSVLSVKPRRQGRSAFAGVRTRWDRHRRRRGCVPTKNQTQGPLSLIENGNPSLKLAV